jgi:hypothetical protein
MATPKKRRFEAPPPKVQTFVCSDCGAEVRGREYLVGPVNRQRPVCGQCWIQRRLPPSTLALRHEAAKEKVS